MDDYQKEITDLEGQIEEMVEAEEDREQIADLQMQCEILKAMYARARELFDQGRDDPELRQWLAMRGYGDWSLDNVYAFIFESAVELPERGHHAFVGGIRDADFARILEAG